MSTSSEPLELARWFPGVDGPPDEQTWRALAEKALRGKPLERLTRTVADDVQLDPIAHEPARQARPSGRPGPWSICQEVRESTPSAAREAAMDEVAGGAEAVWFRLDRATRLGHSSDGEPELDEPCPGLCLRSAHDLATALDGLDLTSTEVVLDGGAIAVPLLDALLGHAASSGNESAEVRTSILSDPLGTLVAEGQLPGSVDTAFRDLASAVSTARERAPHVRVVALSGLPVAEAGGDAVQELAFTLASLAETARRLGEHGLDLGDWLPHTRVLLGLGRDLLVDLAKLRAIRQLWGRLLAAAGQPAIPLVLHARMLDAVVTRRDPWTNLLRATQAGFVGASGGADALTVLPHDRALGVPNMRSRRIVRNLHLLLREESHLDRVDDPAAGSGTLEQLTTDLARAAWTRLQTIEADGGLLAVLQAGTLQDAVHARARAQARRIRTRKDVLVGVSRYPDTAGERPESAPAAPPAPGPTLASATLAGSSTEHPTTVPPLRRFRPAAPWEQLADAVEGSGASVFLAKLGPVASHTARAGFARDLFAAGGFGVHDGEPHDDPDDAATAFGTSGCRLACICGTDDAYERAVPGLARHLIAAGASAVVVAGRFPDPPDPWREAGVTHVVHLGADVLGVLTELARTLDLEVSA